MKFHSDVLYLDYDGVLHPDDVYWRKKKGIALSHNPGHALFENASLLEELLEPYPSVRLVLSTSWVRATGNYSKTVKRLPPSLRARCVGATYHTGTRFHMGLGYAPGDYFNQLSRFEQIRQDYLRRRPNRVLAIDDDTKGWPAQERYWLVAPYTANGIAEPDVRVQLELSLFNTFGRPA